MNNYYPPVSARVSWILILYFAVIIGSMSIYLQVFDENVTKAAVLSDLSKFAFITCVVLASGFMANVMY